MEMRYGRGLLGCFAIAFLAASAWGDIDPVASVESDNFSTAISQFVTTYGSTFDPTANGGVLGLYNDTGGIITSLTLHTTIAQNLTSADIADSFTCNPSGDPFFLHCGFDYNSSNGSLTIEFYGVNPPDGDEFRLRVQQRVNGGGKPRRRKWMGRGHFEFRERQPRALQRKPNVQRAGIHGAGALAASPAGRRASRACGFSVAARAGTLVEKLV
jgi:hypothetical protein